MDDYIKQLEIDFSNVLNGFKPIEIQAHEDYQSLQSEKGVTFVFQAYQSEVYQVRMYAVFLMGYLSAETGVLEFLKNTVSLDPNWRVQEVLAKAFDEFCRRNSYEKSLKVIDEWLNDEKANTRRAVTEGLRIWTGRPYFKNHPEEAIRRLADLKNDESEYVRKSVGNALRDIGKKFPDLLKGGLIHWQLDNKGIQQVYRLASKYLDLTLD